MSKCFLGQKILFSVRKQTSRKNLMKFSIVKNRSKIYMRNLYDHRIYATINIILEKKQ